MCESIKYIALDTLLLHPLGINYININHNFYLSNFIVLLLDGDIISISKQYQFFFFFLKRKQNEQFGFDSSILAILILGLPIPILLETIEPLRNHTNNFVTNIYIYRERENKFLIGMKYI